MSTSAVTVEEPAYVKLMLHAAKYPWAAVNGFLLGEAGSTGTEQITVKDAVPLFHTCTLAPLLETSATMVEAHATSLGLSIVGFYQEDTIYVDVCSSVGVGPAARGLFAWTANPCVLMPSHSANQCMEDNAPGVLATKIMERVDSANGGSSVLFMVSNKRFEIAGDSAVSAFARDANNSFRKHVEVGVSSEAIKAFEAALSQRAEMGLVDMDEHLDDVKKDWRNPGIASA